MLGPTSHGLNRTVLEWFEGNNDFVPQNPDHFFERAFLQLKFTDPEILSVCGFLQQADIKCHNGFLSDNPSELYESRLKKFNEYTLKVLGPGKGTDVWPEMTPCQRTSCKVLLWTVENSNRTFRDHIFSIDQFYGYQSRFMILMTDMAVIEDQDDVRRYISRIISGGHKFNRIVADMRHKQSLGAIAPRDCLLKVVNSIKSTINNLQSEENVLIKTVKSKYEAASGETLPENHITAISNAIQLYLLPGLKNCLDVVETHTKSTSDRVGLWRLPKGADYYQHCLKWHTTTSTTPEQIFNEGVKDTNETLKRVVQIVKLINEKGDMTLKGSDSPSVIMKELFQNKKFRFKEGQEGQTTCMKYCKNLLQEVTKSVDHLFKEKPKCACEVEEMPDAMAQGGPAGFYQEGTLDLTRPGLFYINTLQMSSLIKPQMKSLTAHEAVPGHHFQISRMMENRKLPAFRKLCSGVYAGFVEGWGLYCEYLANEVMVCHVNFYQRLYPLSVEIDM